ncbi:MAG: hypothetical protein IMF15_01470 [Proteobacteria bacterium]|nr:hypothetical protein [Pseudomonadota bacterium]
MAIDRHNLRGKTDSELHEWLSGHDSDSVEYLAGIQELMERNDAPVNRREWIVMGIAIVATAVAIFAVIIMYE